MQKDLVCSKPEHIIIQNKNCFGFENSHPFVI